MNFKSPFPTLILCALLSFAVGCASTSLEPLDLNVVDVNVAEATLFETSLDVSIRVSNPNPEPLKLEGASFKLVDQMAAPIGRI